MNRLPYRLLALCSCAVLLTGCDHETLHKQRYAALFAIEQHANGLTGTVLDLGGAQSYHAAGDSVSDLLAALALEAGQPISTGHLSLLLLHGNVSQLLEEPVHSGTIVPTCAVLWTDEPIPGQWDAETDTPDAMLQAAIAQGDLPASTADRILGDLHGGSGVTAVASQTAGGLTLSLWDSSGFLGLLSTDAARGLALLSGDWDRFPLPAALGESAVTLTACKTKIAVRQVDDHIAFHLTLSLSVARQHGAAVSLSDVHRETIHAMVNAAMQETLTQQGGDLLFLREAACRDRYPDAETMTAAEWRICLQTATWEIELLQHS